MPRAEKYPFSSLKHGESYLVECPPAERDDVANRIGVIAATVWHAHPDNFCRFVMRREAQGIRITRVA